MSLEDALKNGNRLYTIIIPGDGARSARNYDDLLILMRMLDAENKRYMVAVG